MQDLSAITALDVAIGLFFVFFVLSIICSAITELIAQVTNMRARELEKGLRAMLVSPEHRRKGEAADHNDYVSELLSDPRIARLRKKRLRGDELRLPSYIPARTFALAFLDTVAPPDDSVALTQSTNLLERCRTELATSELTIETIKSEPAKRILLDALQRADEVAVAREKQLAALRKEVENAFDETMDRVSGWYKRKSQIVLLVVAAVVVGIANIDTIALTQRFFKDDALRAAVVAKADQLDDGSICTPSEDAKDAKPVEQATSCVDELDTLAIPLGWNDSNTPDGTFGTTGAWWWHVGGMLATVLALSLGAPFWFDVLGKLARLRGVGNREGTEKTRSSAEDKDDPSGLFGSRRSEAGESKG